MKRRLQVSLKLGVAGAAAGLRRRGNGARPNRKTGDGPAR